MPTKPDEREDTPRTDLPPARDPYYEGYFGTDEEEGVTREREEEDGGGADGDAERKRRIAEDAAGGDREI